MSDSITIHPHPVHAHVATTEFFGSTVTITAADAFNVVFHVDEKHPAEVNRIKVEGRAYFKKRTHGPANVWYGENIFFYRIPEDGYGRWNTADITDNMRSKIYRRLSEIASVLPAAMFHAAQVHDLERQVKAKEDAIENAKLELLALQEQHRALQIEHETAALA